MELKELKELITGDTKIVSDNHFGHNSAFEKFEPIRKTIAEDLSKFEKEMTHRWNKSVSTTDNLLHLGDFCINKMKEQKTLDNIENNTSSLNGNKILIKGNHDKTKNAVYLESGWNYVVDKPIILLDKMKVLDEEMDYIGCIITEIDGKRIMFSHFGIFSYDKRFEGKFENQFKYLKKLYYEYKCDLNIHGHSHGNFDRTKESMNVSVENINFTPISISDSITKIFEYKEK